MAPRCLGDLLQDLSDLACLLKERRAGQAPESLLNKLVESGKAPIAAEAPLSIAEASKVYSLLEKASCSDAEKQLAGSRGLGAARKPWQCCQHASQS